MSFEPRRLPDGRIEAPARAETDDGLIGDGVVVLGPSDPMFDEWSAWLDRHEPDAGRAPE